FLVPLNETIRFGETNTIRVDARTHADSRWYAGAGIHRDVVLRVDEPIHIIPNGVRVTSPDIDDDYAVIVIESTVENAGLETATVRLLTVLRDDHHEVASDSVPATIRPGARAVVRQRILVEKPRRWSVESPSLYTAHVRVDENHTVDTTFGIRT
ncbi:glycoside hydrolase family 2, partial [Rhodococcoides corynebacterioides]